MKLQKLLSYTRKAIDDYNMINSGDKIAIGISGGKDSLTLLYALNGLKRFYPKDFDIVAITVDLGLGIQKLDEIEKGSADELSILKELNGEFEVDFKKALVEMEKAPDKETGLVCPKCGKELVKRTSKNGDFFACSGFPKCRYIKGQEEQAPKQDVVSDINCPKCGKPLLIKKGRNNKGDFLACSGFPKCRHIQSIK